MTRERLTAHLPRRGFLAAAASLTVLRPGSARGAPANDALELGLIGCGGRGNWVANLFQKHTPARLVATHDYFTQKAQNTGERYKVPSEQRFDGLEGYKRLVECKLDAVAIESPPYFHPPQAAAAVDAGKHVYVAKPIAVDVPGCHTIAQAGEKASAANLCFLVDFQTRANDFYREAVRRVHAGDLGTLVLAQANYHTGSLGRRGWGPKPEQRLRGWVRDVALSGDIIVEQNIHALDVATWCLDAHPLKAVGTGGNKAHQGAGDCYDHYCVTFTFPHDVVVDFSSTQCIRGHSDIGCLVYGTAGTAHTHYGGHVMIRGNKSYKGGDTGPIFTQGAVANMKTFHQNVTQGRFDNPTVAPSVRSNLTCVLGRTAGRQGRMVTWDEMIEANEKIDARLEGLEA
ncbi:MAG: Gfo/Idh/MocA family protein [Candidatus Brocadiia bacterium]